MTGSSAVVCNTLNTFIHLLQVSLFGISLPSSSGDAKTMATCFSKPFDSNTVELHSCSLMRCLWIFQTTMAELRRCNRLLSAWLLYVKSWPQSAPVSTTSPQILSSVLLPIFMHCFILFSKPCTSSGLLLLREDTSLHVGT